MNAKLSWVGTLAVLTLVACGRDYDEVLGSPGAEVGAETEWPATTIPDPAATGGSPLPPPVTGSAVHPDSVQQPGRPGPEIEPGI
jgi:hypothetical protein